MVSMRDFCRQIVVLSSEPCAGAARQRALRVESPKETYRAFPEEHRAFLGCVHVGVLEQETPKWRFPFPKSKNRLRESKVKRSVFTYMSEHETLGIESLGVPIHVYACICERFFLYRDFLPNKNPKLQAGHCFDVGG